MALDLGELRIALELDRDPFTRGLATTKRELEGLPTVAQREVRKISRTFDDEGRKSGGVLARGISAGMIRNSPLIAAAVGGALAAGAPVAIAGAGILFGGIAAVAASQSLEVRNAWMEMGQDVRAGMVADAAVLVPAFTRMADQIGQSFDRLRPQIQDAFADTEPLLGKFTDGVVALAENGMPGLVRAVAAAGPVFDGLQSFLSDVGSGLTDFFDAMSGHAPAAGTAFAALGQIISDLLPAIGELLSQGAELAADVLPAVASATGLTLDVLQALGPMLPAIVAGFVAFRAAQAAAGFLQTFALQAQFATVAMTGSATAGTKVGGSLAALGRVLPGLAVAFGLASAQMAEQEQQVNEWAKAILDGSETAQIAAQRARDAASGFNEFIDSMQFGDQTSAFEQMFGADDEDRLREAQAEADRLYDSLSRVGQAEQDVTKATNYLNRMLKEHGDGSNEAKGAARALASAEKELAERNGEAERAIQGVTSAMVEQAAQALAMASSDYAYRSSLEGIDDQLQAITDAQFRQSESQAALNEARATGAKPEDIAAAERDLAAATEGVSDAQFELEGSLLAAAEAAGRLASDALPATATELQKQQAAAAGSLAELERLKTEMGANFPPALQQAIDRLKQSGVALTNTSISASDTASRIRDLGFAVNEVPGQKFVKVDAPTGPQIEQLKALGWHVVNLPNGDVYVAANTADAEAAINYAARPRIATVRVETVGGVHITGPGGGGTILRAGGGPVFGPGTETSDSIPARLSRNEHVWTAREVRAAGGHGAIAEMRRAVLAGKGYTAGGPVAAATTAPAMAGRSTHITVEARTNDERRIAKAISERLRDDEFLAGT